MTSITFIVKKPFQSSNSDCRPDESLDGDDSITYGHAEINLTEHEFCSGDNCQNLNVCRLENDAGEEMFYYPASPYANYFTEWFLNSFKLCLLTHIRIWLLVKYRLSMITSYNFPSRMKKYFNHGFNFYFNTVFDSDS